MVSPPQASKPCVHCGVTMSKGAQDGLCISDDSAEGQSCCFHRSSWERPCWAFSAAALQPHCFTLLFHWPIMRLSSYRTLREPCRWEAAPANCICFSVITLQSVKENSSHIYAWVSKWKWEQAIEHLMLSSFFLFKNYHQCCSILVPLLCGVIHLVALESWPWIHILCVGSEQGSGVQRWEHLIWSQTEFLTTVTQMRPPQLIPRSELLLQFGWNLSNSVWSIPVSHSNWQECISLVKQIEGQSLRLKSCRT